MTVESATDAPPPAAGTDRYRLAAMTLHWALAVLILVQLGLGWRMGSLPDDGPVQEAVERLHVSLGLTILLLTLLRIAVRLIHRPPPLPFALSGWERGLARFNHAAFYVLMLALPLTGWALRSFFPRMIEFWGMPVWPTLPVLNGLSREQGAPLYAAVETLHGTVLAWSLLLLIALHLAAALKHQFDGRPVLWRMLPLLRRP